MNTLKLAIATESRKAFLAAIRIAPFVGIVLSLGTTAPAHAYQVYFGEDVNTAGDPNILSVHPKSDAAHDSFLSNLTGVGTETFEGFADGTTAPINLTFPGAGTATLTGDATVNSGNDGFGRYPISGSKYITTQAATAGQTFTVNFSQPVAAFGFYGTDIGDFGGQLALNLTNGSKTTLTVPNTIGSNASTSGSALYYGFYAQNPSEQFTSVAFLNSSTADVFGFDDLTIGSLQQVTPKPPAAVPEPSSMVGTLAFGALGAAYMLKRRKQKPAKPNTGIA